MTALTASLIKELRLLLRDWHALLVLFLMPGLFIVIMSLALQERFGEREQFQLQGLLVTGPDTQADNATPEVHDFIQALQTVPQLALSPSSWPAELALPERAFALVVHPDFTRALDTPGGTGLTLHYAAELGERERALTEAAIQQAFARFYTERLALDLGFDKNYAHEELLREGFVVRAVGESAATPNAVQQSVPAWLIFAMFFIAIPLSTTVIQERSERTLMRLKTLGASPFILYGAKLLPYLLVNLLQLLLMLALGAWLLPLLGAQGLSLAVNLPALLLLGLCTSLAALALASLVATLARTIEQATVASGAINILLAAIGGIMIPTFVMPPVMQQLAQFSPMQWGLAGFLEVLVRDGNLSSIATPCLQLVIFAAALWALVALVIKKEKHHG